MTERKFYRTVYTIEVLSEEPIPACMDIEMVIEEAVNGDYSMKCDRGEQEEVDGKRMVKLLQAQGSDPEFFRITAEGEDTQEYLDEQDPLGGIE